MKPLPHTLLLLLTPSTCMDNVLYREIEYLTVTPAIYTRYISEIQD